jgi:DNA repair photolyase
MDLNTWLQDNDTSEETREKYEYFMRPEPKDVRSEIMVEEETGLRYRMMAVGMVRNEKNRKVYKVYLDPIPHIRIEKAKGLQGWYKGKTEKKGVRARPCYTDAMLTQPYGGYCNVGCAFCYINSGIRGYRGSGLITVPMGYGEQVAAQLGKFKTSAAGYFSSFTDPFTPLEDVYHNSQRGIQAFTSVGLPVFVLSRYKFPQWAMDALMGNPHNYAQKSVNTWDPVVWKKLSPSAASLETHMEDIRELKDRGIYISIQVNPIIPGIVNHQDVIKTFEMLAEAGTDHVIIKFVEASYNWAPAMVTRMRKRFGKDYPERVDEFERLFVDNIGGQRTVAEDYRMEGHKLYQAAATALGMTYSVCYEYKYERNTLGQITSKTGISVGPEFTTADQCHGKRVPMYSRESLAQPFKPVPECPPSGCLYCQDPETGKGACGSALFGAAPALRSKDFQHSVWEDVPSPVKVEEVKEEENPVMDMFGSSDS